MNGLEWLFKIDDQAMAPALRLQKQLNATEAAGDKLDKTIAKTSQTNYGFTPTIKGLENVGQTAEGLGGKLNLLKSGFGAVFSVAAPLLAVTSIGAIGKAIYDAGANMEQTRTAYNVLIGDMQKSNKLIAELKTFADISPLTDQQVYDAGKMLLTVLPPELIRQREQQLSDISMGKADVFNRLTANYQQIKSIGRAGLQDIKQFGNAGIDIFGELTKVTGKSGKALEKLISDGGATAQVIDKVLDNLTKKGGKYYGMTEAQAKTTGGKASTLFSNLGGVFIKIFNKLQPFINKMLDFGIKVLPKVESALRGVYNFLKPIWDFFSNTIVIDTIAFSIGGLAVAWGILNAEMLISEGAWLLGGGLVMVLEGVQNLTKAFLNLDAAVAANPLGAILGLLVLVGAEFFWMYENFSKLRELIFGIGEVFSQAWENIATTFHFYLDPIFNAIAALFKRDFKALGSNLGIAALHIMNGQPDNPDNSLATAWERGQMKGAMNYTNEKAAREKRKREGKETIADKVLGVADGTNSLKDLLNTGDLLGTGGTGTDTSGNGASVTGGGGVRNVYVYNTFNLSAHGESLEGNITRIADMAMEKFITSLRDAEVIIGGKNG